MCVLSVFVRSRSAESHGKASRDGGAAVFFVLLSPLSSLCLLFSSFLHQLLPRAKNACSEEGLRINVGVCVSLTQCVDVVIG